MRRKQISHSFIIDRNESRMYGLKRNRFHSETCIRVAFQVGFAELKETADDQANIGATIIGAPIVGQQLAEYILTDHQDAECRPMIRLIPCRKIRSGR